MTAALEKWERLPASVQADILDKHRDWNTSNEWWGCVYEGFEEDMKAIGIQVDRMYFSGFWSQGDGACFEGEVWAWGPFLESLGHTNPLLIHHFDNHASFSVQQHGHYNHENCTTFSMDFCMPDEFINEEEFLRVAGFGEELRDAALIAVLNEYDGNKLEEEFKEAFKNHMRALYERLEEEYEYLTSDEQVLESLVANDMLDDLIAEHTEELEMEDE
jgi:hypothetical protein